MACVNLQATMFVGPKTRPHPGTLHALYIPHEQWHAELAIHISIFMTIHGAQHV